MFVEIILSLQRKVNKQSSKTKVMSEKIYDNRLPIRETLKDMSVDDIVVFPAEKTSVLRATASNVGLELGREYKTRTNRDERVIRVVRTA